MCVYRTQELQHILQSALDINTTTIEHDRLFDQFGPQHDTRVNRMSHLSANETALVAYRKHITKLPGYDNTTAVLAVRISGTASVRRPSGMLPVGETHPRLLQSASAITSGGCATRGHDSTGEGVACVIPSHPLTYI